MCAEFDGHRWAALKPMCDSLGINYATQLQKHSGAGKSCLSRDVSFQQFAAQGSVRNRKQLHRVFEVHQWRFKGWRIYRRSSRCFHSHHCLLELSLIAAEGTVRQFESIQVRRCLSLQIVSQLYPGNSQELSH
jgi:hypothetical protein